MNQLKTIAIVSPIVLGVGALSVILAYQYKKRQEELTSDLLKALKALFDPSEALQGQIAFDPNYISVLVSQGKQVSIWRQDRIQPIAEQLHEALESWFDRGDAITILAQLPTKVQVSQVASAYQSRYEKQLLHLILEKLSKSQITTILNRVISLPDH